MNAHIPILMQFDGKITFFNEVHFKNACESILIIEGGITISYKEPHSLKVRGLISIIFGERIIVFKFLHKEKACSPIE